MPVDPARQIFFSAVLTTESSTRMLQLHMCGAAQEGRIIGKTVQVRRSPATVTATRRATRHLIGKSGKAPGEVGRRSQETCRAQPQRAYCQRGLIVSGLPAGGAPGVYHVAVFIICRGHVRTTVAGPKAETSHNHQFPTFQIHLCRARADDACPEQSVSARRGA